MDANTLAEELLKVRKELADVQAQSAARRPVEEIVKYLLYFWLSLSVLLGVFGWKQISDLNTTISNEVSKQLPRDSEQYRKYDELISDTKKLVADFDSLTKQYRERVEDLKYADIVASDFDLEGQLHRIVVEANDPRKVADDKWRTKAITVLGKLKATLATRYFPADFIFNAAQVCRQLQQFQLAEDLTAAAFLKDATPPIRALKLASLASNKAGPERASAFSELMNMVEALNPEHSPQIVLAEAWNAAESTRNYGPLLLAIDKYLARSDTRQPPSYTFIIKAQAHLRRSQAGDAAAAKSALQRGRELFAQETPMSQWSEEFAAKHSELLAAATSNQAALLGRESNASASRRGEMEKLLQLLEVARRRGALDNSPVPAR